VSKKRLISEIQKVGKPGTRSVMIVDDNDLDRQQIRRIVEEEGLKPIVAEGGAVCLELIKKQVPDVLVLDLMMPEPDGFAVLERIRSNPDTRDLPVIVVTAKDLTEEDRKKLSGNVFSVLEKSAAKSATLLAEIKRILIDLEHSQYRGPERRAAPPRILLVEDNEAAIIQVKAVLESAGYVTDVARGGQEAMDYVSRTLPDGIILDLMMPEIDGFAVLGKIRGAKATADIPVLVLTAKDLTPEDFKRLSANHVQQLVQKGDVDRENLLFKISVMLGTPSGSQARLYDGAGGITEASRKFMRRRGDANSSLLDRRKAAGASQDVTSTGVLQVMAAGPPAILIVEDNADNMTTIKAVLQNRYRILAATDGEEGLRMAAEARPDLILLDMALPKMDGYTVVRHIKTSMELSRIPVIAMTARVMKGDREKILAAGCDDYISKPIDPEGFLQKIGEWLKG
jgi:CheY-like chemotaxis protein